MGDFSCDEFCRYRDIALSGIDSWVKVTDGVLEWDAGYAQHFQLLTILDRYKQHGIIINADMFIFAAPEGQYCGYNLPQTEIIADSSKVKPIAQFPTLCNLTDQLEDFTPAPITSSNTLEPFVSPRNQFIWNPVHQDYFECVKQAFSPSEIWRKVAPRPVGFSYRC